MWILYAAALAAGLPDVDQPLKTGNRADGDAALVVGIEDYAFIADVPHAARDAAAFYDLLVYTLGIPPERVRLLNRGAAKEQIEAAATDIGKLAKPGATAWVFFAGHGAADPSTGARILLGDDTRQDPTAFSARAVSVDTLTSLAGGGGASVRFLSDACYGGLGRSGAELAPGKRFAVPTYAAKPQSRDLHWYAASGDQLAGPLDAAQHGAFTYLAIGALRGWADGELDGARDGNVTAREASAYVSRSLRTLQLVDQTPELAGSPDEVLVASARLEAAPTLTVDTFRAPGAQPATPQPQAMAAPAQPTGGKAVTVGPKNPFGNLVSQIERIGQTTERVVSSTERAVESVDRVGDPRIAPAPAPVVYASTTLSGTPAMDEGRFQSLLQQVRAQSFSDDKKNVVRQAAFSLNFNIDQLGRIIDEFTYDADRVEVVRLVAGRVVDPENSFLLASHFSFSASADEALATFR